MDQSIQLADVRAKLAAATLAVQEQRLLTETVRAGMQSLGRTLEDCRLDNHAVEGEGGVINEQDHLWGVLDDLTELFRESGWPTPENGYKLDGGWPMALADLKKYIGYDQLYVDQVMAERDAISKRLEQALLAGSELRDERDALKTHAKITLDYATRLESERDAREKWRVVRLGEVIKKWRVMSEQGLRETAKDIGINASTLVRIEAGEGMDAQTLAAVLCWLMDASNEHPQR